MQEPKNKPAIKLKPWGKEVWFAQTDNFAGKVLYLNKGHRYSLQYHEYKTETQYVFAGQIKFLIGPSEDNLKTLILNPGDKIDVTPLQVHRAEAIEDSIIFEVSTPELTDVVKLADDYGRSGKGNNEQLDAQLSQQKIQSIS